MDMYKATIHKINCIPYTLEELNKKSKDERRSIEYFGYEKPLSFEMITEISTDDIQYLKEEIIKICRANDPLPIIVTLNDKAKNRLDFMTMVKQNVIVDTSFIVGHRYRRDDPEAIFEVIIFYNKDDCIEELVRILSKDYQKVAVTEDYYFELQQTKLQNYIIQAIINVIPEEGSIAYWST